MPRNKRIKKRKRSAIRRTGKLARRTQFGKRRAKMPRKLMRFSRMLNQVAEKKFVDDVATTTSISSSGLLMSPPMPVIGTGNFQRIGTNIFARYWKIQGFIDQNQSSSTMIRMAYVYPKNISIAIGDAPTADFNQFFDHEKWTVVWDKLIPLCPYFTGATVAENTGTLTKKPFSFTFKLFEQYMFNSSPAQPQTPVPKLFLYSDSSSITTNPTINYTQRLTYTDV